MNPSTPSVRTSLMLILSLLLLGTGCSDNNSAGSSSNTTNSIAGTFVVTESGVSVAKQAEIVFRKSTLAPGAVDSTTAYILTDTDGNFFTELEYGVWMTEARAVDHNNKVALQEIEVKEGEPMEIKLNSEPTADVAAFVSEKFLDSLGPALVKYRVGIPGTSFAADVKDPNNYFDLNSVPSGTWTFTLYDGAEAIVSRELKVYGSGRFEVQEPLW